MKISRPFNFRLILVYLFIIIGGAYVIVLEVIKTDRELRNKLKSYSVISSELLNRDDILLLTGTIEDTSSYNYQKLKQDLHNIRISIPDCRFTYLIGKNGDDLFFYVDSEPSESEDMSPPGQLFSEAPEILYKMFDDIDVSVDGPNKDRWGTWISCFSQVRNHDTGEVIAVFGADVSFRQWKTIIVRKSLFSVALIILAVIAISIAFLLGRKVFLVRRDANQSLSLFKEALDNSTDAVGMSTPDGKHYYQNKAFDELFGTIGEYPPDTLYVDKPMGDEIFQILKKGGQVTREVKMNRKDRTVADVLLRAYANKDKDGKIISLVGVHNDISEKSKAAEELNIARIQAEESNANIRSIIDNTTENIWAVDKKYRLIYINRVFQQEFHDSFGVTLEQGDLILKSLPEPISSVWKERYNHAFSGEHFFFDDEIIVAEGVMVYVYVSMNPIIVSGEVIGVSVFASNITERKMQEKELVKAKERAEESDRLKTAFLQNISHEIRTPLNAISGFSDLLNKQGLSEEKRREFISIIQNNSHQLAAIVSDILTISSIDAKQARLHCETVNVNELMVELEKNYQQLAKERNIAFSLLLCSDNKQHEVFTDKTKLQQILSNLINNAFKFTKKGEVEFGCSLKGEMLEFFVRDTGIGIAQNELEKIFHRFHQSENPLNRKYGGTGLGLSISASFVRLLGGEIYVESEFGKESKFVFTIPCIK